MNEAYLLTGGNRDDRTAYLTMAAELIASRCGRITHRSALYETAAWGFEDQDPFLNQALRIETEMDAPELMTALLRIEHELGRVRGEKYGPRTIDIDILLYNDLILSTEGLTLPHPRMAERRFVLVPLNDIAPQLLHPLLNKTVSVLLEECGDTLPVQKFS